MQVGVVVHRGLGLGHHVQVGGRIGFQPLHDDKGIAEQLPQPGADLFSSGERLALLDPRQDAQELGPANVVDRHLLEAGQHVLVEDPQDLRQRAVPAFLDFLAAMLDPRIEDGLEGVVGRQLDRVSLLFAICMGVDALGQERAGFIAQGARFAQSDLGVVPEGDALLLTEPVVAQVPGLAASGGNHQAEAIGIGDAVGFFGSLGLPHGQIRECHHQAPKS